MTAFYNEREPYAAQWLRNLIDAGAIAPGVVDERDIRDIHPDELAAFTQCHFFAGIGIWSLALRRAGWPDDAPIWTGSCPCQPFSAAGRGAGVADERHLWPHWFHLISERRPAIVLGEQVASKGGLGWFDLVSADLEGAGYAVGASDLCAAGFGGAHIRQRLYFVGVPALADARREQRLGWGAGQTGDEPATIERAQRLCDASRLADADGERQQYVEGGRPPSVCAPPFEPAEIEQESGNHGASVGGMADAQHHDGRADEPRRLEEGRAADGRSGQAGELGDADRARSEARLSDTANGKKGNAKVADDGGDRLPRPDEGRPDPRGMDNADGGDAGAERQQLCRFDGLEPENGSLVRGGIGGLGHDAGGELGRTDPPLLGRAPADWLLCRDGQWRPVEPRTFPLVNADSPYLAGMRADRRPSRAKTLSGIGNALDAETATAFVCSVIEALLDVDATVEAEARAVA